MKLLNHEIRYEVYNEVRGLPKLPHFTPNKHYRVLNEMIEGAETKNEYVLTDHAAIVQTGYYGGLSYMVHNDEGQLICVPHVYFNRDLVEGELDWQDEAYWSRYWNKEIYLNLPETHSPFADAMAKKVLTDLCNSEKTKKE